MLSARVKRSLLWLVFIAALCAATALLVVTLTPRTANSQTSAQTATFPITASLDDQFVAKNSSGYPPSNAALYNSWEHTVWAERSLHPGGNYEIVNGLLRFNTSNLPDDATITGARLQVDIFSMESANGLSLTGDWFNWDGSNAEADYSAMAQTGAIAPIEIGYFVSGPKSFDLLNASTNISKTGTSSLRLHIDGGPPTGMNYVKLASWNHDTAAEPKLVVTYTTDQAAPLPSGAEDTTDPQITITTPPQGATYTLGQSVAASYDCTDADSGVASCEGPVADGANIDTSSTGTKTFTVDATDKAGNTNFVSHTYTVNDPTTPGGDTTDPFVRVEGTRFTLGGVDYKPVGFNQGNLAGSAFYACGAENNPVDHAGRVDHLRRMKAMNADVVRFFAFQAFATRNGVRDWSAMDSVMRAADEVGIKVMPALGDHWEWCAPESRKDGAWYGGGYKVKNPDSRHATSYEQYVREFATRYAQEDAIAFVSLMNEPRGPFNELYAFCRDVSAIYKQYDSNHPLTCGVGGNNEQGSVNDEYERMHAIPTIDFADYHDYSQDVFNGSPLVPQVSLSTRLYAQAANWQWGNGAGIRNSARVWQKVSYTVPSNHPNPLQRLGLQLTGAFAGTIYVDDVVVGGTTYSFGSGVQNFRGEGAVTSVAHTSAFGRNGTGALKATKDSRNDGFVYRPSTGSAGVSVSAWVYVDDPGSLTTNNSLAGTVRKANEVFGKPHMVGEAGLQCGPSYRTASSRASLFDQRIAAHRNAGGDAYLAWVWHPTKSCNNTYDVTSGDPLSSVLGKY